MPPSATPSSWNAPLTCTSRPCAASSATPASTSKPSAASATAFAITAIEPAFFPKPSINPGKQKYPAQDQNPRCQSPGKVRLFEKHPAADDGYDQGKAQHPCHLGGLQVYQRG